VWGGDVINMPAPEGPAMRMSIAKAARFGICRSHADEFMHDDRHGHTARNCNYRGSKSAFRYSTLNRDNIIGARNRNAG
jgi:hypothetical protein